MPFSHNGLKTATGIQLFSQVNIYTLSYRFLYGNVQGCVFAKNRPVSLNWRDYTIFHSYWQLGYIYKQRQFIVKGVRALRAYFGPL